MNRFQLAHLPTQDLIQLRRDVNRALSDRHASEGKHHARLDFIASLKPQTLQPHHEITAHNCSAILRIPRFDVHKTANLYANKARYLPAFLAQDWGAGAPEQGDHYVYVHVDPEGFCFCAAESAGGNFGGLPFYIGKGIGSRAFDLKRNEGHWKLIRALLKKGFTSEHIARIILTGLSEKTALDYERKLICFFGTMYDETPGPLVNLAVVPPAFVGEMKRYPSKVALREAVA